MGIFGSDLQECYGAEVDGEGGNGSSSGKNEKRGVEIARRESGRALAQANC